MKLTHLSCSEKIFEGYDLLAGKQEKNNVLTHFSKQEPASMQNFVKTFSRQELIMLLRVYCVCGVWISTFGHGLLLSNKNYLTQDIFCLRNMPMEYSVILGFNPNITGPTLSTFETFSNLNCCISNYRIMFVAKSADPKLSAIRIRGNHDRNSRRCVVVYLGEKHF